jgi:hypothetical protein
MSQQLTLQYAVKKKKKKRRKNKNANKANTAKSAAKKRGVMTKVLVPVGSSIYTSNSMLDPGITTYLGKTDEMRALEARLASESALPPVDEVLSLEAQVAAEIEADEQRRVASIRSEASIREASLA